MSVTWIRSDSFGSLDPNSDPESNERLFSFQHWNCWKATWGQVEVGHHRIHPPWWDLISENKVETFKLKVVFYIPRCFELNLVILLTWIRNHKILWIRIQSILIHITRKYNRKGFFYTPFSKDSLYRPIASWKDRFWSWQSHGIWHV